jgi:nicotinamidase-related amidase
VPPVPDDFLRRFEERGLTRELGFGQSPAVLVVDYMRAFTDPEHAFGSDLDSEIETTRRLLDGAREAGVPVLFTVCAYDTTDLSDAGIWAIKVPASASLRAGTPDVELDPRLGRREDESVVLKKYASGFFGTDLASRLNARRIDTLVIAGCTTSGCVRATVVDALQHGFRPMVVREAVGDRSEQAHAQSMLDMQAKYADVVSVDRAIEELCGLPTTTGP